MDFEDEEIERYSVLPGDLMICEGGEIGKCAIVPDIFPAGIYYQKALHRVRKRKKDSGNVNFLYYVIFCMAKNDCFGEIKLKTMIFPRYHQLDVVTKLLADVKINGFGKNYLIQHSAGDFRLRKAASS